MTDKTVPYLCGGIFFSLLNEINIHGTERHSLYTKGNNEGSTAPKLMRRLYYVIAGHELLVNKDSLASYVSRYRHCVDDGGKKIPFSSEPLMQGFGDLVRNDYPESIRRMKQLAKDCLDINNTGNIKWIVKVILQIVRDDNTIDDSTEFFILKNSQPVSKKAMLLLDQFDFYPFLIGVLHYIITKPTENKKGQATYEKLFPNQPGNGQGKASTNFLTPLEHDISVHIDKHEDIAEIDDDKQEDMVVPPKNDDDKIANQLKGTQGIKFLYKSDSMEKWEEELIGNFDSSIINLNENAEGYRVNDEKCIICRLTSDFQFSSHFIPPCRVEMVKIDFSLGNEKVYDFTSLKNWKSESEIRKILFRGVYNCTAWIRVELQPNNEYFVKIIAMGGKF